jgi:hypothetical protein
MIDRLNINVDIWDLKNHVAQGASLAETSEFLCRSDEFEVARKAKELGLTWQRAGRKAQAEAQMAL